jgi:hypothetical protein
MSAFSIFIATRSSMKKKKKKPGRPIRPKRLGNKNIPIIPKLRLCIVALVWSFYINICIDYAKI